VLDAQTAQAGEDGDTRQQQSSPQVSPDEQRPATEAIDPDTGEHADQEHWRRLYRQQPAHFACIRAEHEHRREW
jgi:hypothetical protein